MNENSKRTLTFSDAKKLFDLETPEKIKTNIKNYV
jgi:hypothetical protein